MRTLFELGYSVIPVNGKVPAFGVKDHRRWCREAQPESLIDEYEKIQSTGFAVIAGEQSGVLFVDIDSESEDLRKLIPPSPIVKKGARGETRVFKYNPNIPNKLMKRSPNLGPDSDRYTDEGIDFLTDGAYSVWPPSFHPAGGKYIYLSLDTLENFDKKDLPEFPRSAFDAVYALLEAPTQGVDLASTFVHQDTSRCPHGSQARLKALSAGMVAAGTPIDKAVEDLLRYDRTHHQPIGYFWDRSRSDCAADPYSNAAKFYGNILASINRDRARRNEPPQTPNKDKIEIILPGQTEVKLERSYPTIGGLIGNIQSAILSISRTEQKDMALGTALAVCGALTANRFKLNNQPVYSTMYVMNVAGTGAGKGASIDFISELFGFTGLGDEQFFKLKGISNYSSEAAIIAQLKEQRARLDVVDEFGKVFKGLSAKGDHKAAVGDCLKSLFSAKKEFSGHFTKTDGNTGRCAYPSVSILASIQPETLIATASEESVFDGFVNRFLYFTQNSKAKYLGNQMLGGVDAGKLDDIVREIKSTYPANPLNKLHIPGVPEQEDALCDFARQEIHETKEYRKFFRDYDFQLNERTNQMQDDGRYREAALMSRLGEHADKLSKIICIALGGRILATEHAELGVSIAETSFERTKSILLAAGGGKHEKDVAKIRRMLEMADSKTIKKSILLRNSNMSSAQLKSIIDTMTESGEIKVGPIESGGAIHVQLIS